MEQKNLRVQKRVWEMPNMNKLFLTCNVKMFKNEPRFAKMLKWVKIQQGKVFIASSKRVNLWINEAKVLLNPIPDGIQN